MEHTITVARPSDEEIEQLEKLLERLFNGDYLPIEIADEIESQNPLGTFDRLVLAYRVLFDTFCDPNFSYLVRLEGRDK